MIKSEMTVLYVDVIDEDEVFATTTNQKSISFNILKINEFHGRPLSTSPKQYFYVGRFIGIIVPVEDSRAHLLFYDLKKDHSKVHYLLSAFKDEIDKNLFKEIVHHVEANYEKDYYKVVLTIGQPRTEPL